MAQLAFNQLGQAAGSLVGMPHLGGAVGSLVGGALMGPTEGKGSRLDDLQVTSSAYGVPVSRGFGTYRIGGNIIWSPGIKGRKVSGGLSNLTGKGGGLFGQSGYAYTCSFAVALGKGVVSDVLAIWADSKLIYAKGYDQTSVVPGTEVVTKTRILTSVGGTKKTGIRFRFYSGTEDQLPDPTIEAQEGVGMAPAHRGIAYLVFEDLALADFGNRIPSITAQLAMESEPAYPYLGVEQLSTPGVSSGVALAINWDTGTYYTVSKDLSSLLVTDALTMSRQAPVPFSSIYSDGSATRYPGALATDRDGFIYMSAAAGANSEPIVKVDPTSLHEVARFGTTGSGLGFTATTAVALAGLAPFYSGTTTYMVCNGLLNSFGVLDANTMEMVWWDGIGGQPMLLPHGLTSPGLIGVYQPVDGTAYLVAHSSRQDYNTQSPIVIAKLVFPSTVTTDADGAPTNVSVTAPWTIRPSDVIAACPAAQAAGMTSFYGVVSSSAWDPTDQGIIFTATLSDGTFNNSMIVAFKWTVSGGVVWATSGLSGAMPPGSYELDGSYLAYAYGSQIIRLDCQTGGLTESAWPSLNVSVAYQAFSSRLGVVLGLSGQTNGAQPYQGDGRDTSDALLFLDRASAATAELKDIVTALCGEAGLLPADLDVSQLTDVVPGYCVTRPSTTRASLEPLAQVYLFDCVESDGVLKFVKRSNRWSTRTIPERDLGLASQKSGGDVIVETRMQDFDLPAKVHLAYVDPGNNFLTGSAASQRMAGPIPTASSSGNLSLSLAIVLNAEDATRATEQILYSAWLERSSYELVLSWSHLDLDPTDVVTIVLDDQAVYETTLRKIEVGADYAVKAGGVSALPAASFPPGADGGPAPLPPGMPTRVPVPNTSLATVYQSTATPAVTYPASSQQVISVTMASRLFVLDLPLLRDQDDLGGVGVTVYVGAAAYGNPTSWPGATVFQSVDGTTYDAVATVTTPLTWGTCTSALPDAPDGFSWDTTTQLRVVFSANATLESVSDDQVLTAFANAFAVRGPSGWEVIQAANVVRDSSGTYVLSRILRGRKGTDVNAVGHQIGDAVVVLSASALTTFSMAPADVNKARYYKAVTTGQLIEDAQPQTVTCTGLPLKPYAPEQAHAAKTGTPGAEDVTLSWVRRTRVGGELQDGTGEVPLSEATEAYSVDVLSGPSGTVLRTLSASSPSVIYSNAQVVADFGAIPSTLTVRVYQISSVVGRGDVHEATVGVN